ncbi:MAG TPA: Fe-S protein assembly co-chaperone HscB [Terracidiphilus sp.]|nr:Fe-S protein assembly co-chaperone HscB [Terracidiphilus sp.]
MFKVIDSAVPIACWSCSIGHNDSTLFCPHCSKIQPPPGGDYFSVFSLEPKLNLDLPALEHEFHRLSRKLHPDRFARAEENEKQWSLADTALLNDAYRTLKDPIRRTEYLLKLLGAEIGEDTSQAHSGHDRKDPSRVPADLLEEVFELNMQLEEMRSARKSGVEDSALHVSLEQAKRKFDVLLEAVDEDLHTEWKEWDEGDRATRGAAQKKLVALLDRRRYLSNLVRDVNEVLGA